MNVRFHIDHVEQCSDYRGDDPSVPETWDVYDVYECAHNGCEETFTLAVELSPQDELVGQVRSHLERDHPEIL